MNIDGFLFMNPKVLDEKLNLAEKDFENLVLLFWKWKIYGRTY